MVTTQDLEDQATARVRARGGVPLTPVEELCVQRTEEREREKCRAEDDAATLFITHLPVSNNNEMLLHHAVDEVVAQPAPRQKPRLLHVVQRLPEGATPAAAIAVGKRILGIAGVGPGARFYLEQDGECARDMGKRIHIHCALFFTGAQSTLVQRIVQKKIAAPNMTQVFKHDNLFKLTRYLTGHKSPEKARKVATDKAWRKANGLKGYYTCTAAAGTPVDDQSPSSSGAQLVERQGEDEATDEN